MNNDLVRYSSGRLAVPKHDRAVAAEAKAIYDEARVTAMQTDAVCAVSGRIMEGLTELDGLRRSLAHDDPALNYALGEIEQQAIRTVARIQRNMFGWGG